MVSEDLHTSWNVFKIHCLIVVSAPEKASTGIDTKKGHVCVPHPAAEAAS